MVNYIFAKKGTQAKIFKRLTNLCSTCSEENNVDRILVVGQPVC
jgi:hypothetical protein